MGKTGWVIRNKITGIPKLIIWEQKAGWGLGWVSVCLAQEDLNSAPALLQECGSQIAIPLLFTRS